MNANEAEEILLRTIATTKHNPLKHALISYPWGTPQLPARGPRIWQAEFLTLLKEHLENPETRHQPFQFGGSSGHGIGKSALISMVINWALDTVVDTRVVVTANTETQLRTKTWPEVTKWRKLSITKHWFDCQATSMVAMDKDHEKTWRADATPWSKNNTEAFAGLHNERKRIVIIMDEASSIDDKVWEVIEGALTDENTEIIWIVFGNPTRNSGRFRECFRKYRHRWKTMQIDSRTVEGTNKTQIQKWIDDHGEDSDFVKVRVRGIFPSTSFKQFISTDDVDAAFGKHLKEHQYDFAPKILTCDPAWSGEDELVIGFRQGLKFSILATMPKNDNDVFVAQKLAQLETELGIDAVFIDAGYGTGIVSVGSTFGRNWQLVWFGGKPLNKGYLNKRSEMWGEARAWLKAGGAIPKDDVLYTDLVSPETVPRADGKIQLESKEDMKSRGVPSPNRADALVLSFAFPVLSKAQAMSQNHDNHKSDYDPLATR